MATMNLEIHRSNLPNDEERFPCKAQRAAMSMSATLENGYTCVANALLEAMFEAHLSARQWAVCMALIRKTFGYQKTQDDIGLSQLVALTKIAKSHVSTTINELVARNIVHKKRGTYGHILAVNTYYASWQQKAKLSPSPKASAIDDATMTSTALIAQVAQRAKIVGNGEVKALIESVTDADAQTLPESVTESGTHTKTAAEPVTQALPHWEKEDYQIGKTPVAGTVTTKENHTKESIQKKTPKETIASPAMRERFERFYLHYPKKKSRAVAEKAFCKIAPDENLLASMLQGIERAMTSTQWANPQMIPYPASWLNAQGWLDDIQTDYATDERTVIETFNEALGEQLGMVDSAGFVESRAGAIRHFLTLSKKPNWVSIYFSYVKTDCEIPPKTGFDWLIKPETFAKVREGHYQTP